ncbi:MAG: putative rane protein [Bacteroidetes bacterium]|nr:putative rane protein [Bacteroidota bacterium]
MQIDRKDVIWNLTATVLKIASGVLILPVVLKYLTPDEVGMWTIFLSFSSVTLLFDFGFSQTFARNITYIFSGASQLHKRGFEVVEENTAISYALLKSTIKAMKWFYARISFIIFITLILGGTFYVNYIIKTSFTGNSRLIISSWIIYALLISYQAYTLYFDSLLLGRGMIKKNKQIIIISQIAFIVVSLFLIVYFKSGLLGIVIGQAISVIINRTLSHFAFYDKLMQFELQRAEVIHHKETLRNISPNAVKIGITSLGSFLVNKSAVFIGSLYLPLASIASYGISKQVVDMIVAVATIWFSTYYPQMIQDRINNSSKHLKELYIKSKIFYIILFILAATILVVFGNTFLDIINTNTMLLSTPLLILLLIITFLENNHSQAGSILLTKNEVPFFKASITAGVFTSILLLLFLLCFKWGVIALILAPGISQGIYNNWKWPMDVKKDIGIKMKDYAVELKKMCNKLLLC